MNTRKPSWLKVTLPKGGRYHAIHRTVTTKGLHTVCQEAHCPNIGECWESGAATFMILGNTCTRGCAFCAVTSGNPNGLVDASEPAQVAAAAVQMGLDYAVVTSVTRDDLIDGGAALFARTVRALKNIPPPPLVELLIPDYTGDPLSEVISASPDVIAHNIEVVERLTPDLRHGRFSYKKSLNTLEQIKNKNPKLITKSSIMLGLGETQIEVESALCNLRQVGVDILVLGQYLQPTRDHTPVVAYISPERFDDLAQTARAMGFSFVAAGPLVRTSYKAAEAFAKQKINQTYD
ncbi:MAG: lipoyl synthase [Myxococcota bacterium]|nr:lipoyl synthase [Myxococcota bacterium]